MAGILDIYFRYISVVRSEHTCKRLGEKAGPEQDNGKRGGEPHDAWHPEAGPARPCFYADSAEIVRE